jgi:uncharacterized protein (DUF1501 family)
MTKDSSRREFLRWSAGFSVMGAAAPLAISLTAAGAASAAEASDYKAIVCLFMAGGQDGNNMVLATDPDSFGRYTAARSTGIDPIALMAPGAPAKPPAPNGRINPSMWGGVLPFTPKTPQAIPAGTVVNGTRTFAVHPFLGPILPLFQQGRLAVLANVGMLLNPLTKAQFVGKQAPIPPALFSHNDQQSAWQAGAIDGAQTGWGGRLGDLLSSMNGTNTVFTAITADASAVFLSGNIVGQYQVNTNGSPAVVIDGRSGTLFGSSTGGSTLNAIIQNIGGTSNLANDHATVVTRAINATASLNSAVGGPAPSAIAPPPTFFEPIQGFQDVNPWTTQLFTVAQLIAAAPALGVRRQVFFCQLNAHDTHDTQNTREALNLAQLADALVYFDQAMSNVGGVDMRANVTTFTASDFSRGFATNGTGTDHAWGGHHFIMGGAVRGGDMYGQYPTLGIDKGSFNNPDIAGNNMIPTTSVDQFGATLGRWFGASDSDLRATVFPRLGGYATPYLGFL